MTNCYCIITIIFQIYLIITLRVIWVAMSWSHKYIAPHNAVGERGKRLTIVPNPAPLIGSVVAADDAVGEFGAGGAAIIPPDGCKVVNPAALISAVAGDDAVGERGVGLFIPSL